MYAKWIANDVYVGNIHHRKRAIAKGDIRKIHAKDKDQYILEGSQGSKYFGWVDGSNLIVAETREELEA